MYKKLNKCYYSFYSVTIKKLSRLFSISKNKSLIKQLKSFIMKKTIIMSAIALSFTLVTAYANPIKVNNDNSYVLENIVEASPFHLSIVKGDLETVKKLIELGSNVDKKWNGLTPVMYAAKFNRTEILKLLIEKGADLKKKCDKGHTALDYAEMSNAKEAKVILENELEKK